MYRIEINHTFDAAHQLTDSPLLWTKECARLHGHTYKVRVVITANKLMPNGMVCDFKMVKELINKNLDHKNINVVFAEVYPGAGIETTAENIAAYIHSLINESLGQHGSVEAVSVCEGYKGEYNSNWVTYS